MYFNCNAIPIGLSENWEYKVWNPYPAGDWANHFQKALEGGWVAFQLDKIEPGTNKPVLMGRPKHYDLEMKPYES